MANISYAMLTNVINRTKLEDRRWLRIESFTLRIVLDNPTNTG